MVAQAAIMYQRASWCYDSYYKQHYPQYEIVDFCDIYQPRNEYGDLVPAEMMSYEDIMMFADENDKCIV